MHRERNYSIKIFLMLSLIMTSIFQINPAYGWEGTVEKFIVCEDIDISGRIRQPINEKDIFLNSEFRIYAYLLITESKEPVVIRIDWIEPNGETFTSQEYNLDERPYNITRVSYLEISTITSKIGDWKVDAYANDGLIVSTKFNLMASEPLLSIIDIERSPSGGEPIYLGNPFQITYTVKNVGGADANRVRFTMEEIDPAGALEIKKPTETKDLKSGATDSWTMELIGKKPGEINGSVKLYLKDTKAWSWEWNIFISLPELDLINQTVYPEEIEPVRPGDVVTVRYVFRNVGYTDAKDIGINIEVPDGLKLISVTSPRDIGPGQDAEYFVELETLKEGLFEANITVNSFGHTINEGKLTVRVSPTLISNQLIGFIAIIAIFLGIVIGAIIIMRRRSSNI
ncbi:MAG: hypothetical protein NWE86_08580 [Candidatus Bathyarchaeota archaeon]|nr:hypothetical protein [Candidatus Bathyarchaeota archaeon]